jgi:hypothetical protein
MTNEIENWPAGRTYVFQGTVAEDGTAGTHVSSLVVSPGAGNEMQIIAGEINAGNGAANLTNAIVDDGTNNIYRLIPSNLSLAANENVSFPTTSKGVTLNHASSPGAYFVSGAMRLRLSISTATVSLTHGFAVACRFKGAKPTAALADTIGSPTLTTNTDAVF